MELLITLGHNSSAILVDNEEVLCGYEEERLSKIKADSSFPEKSIEKILEFYPNAREEVTKIFISHWFWDLTLVNNKYLDLAYLNSTFINATLNSITKELTHHDLHARSLWNFLDGDSSGLTIVADGFGTFGECLSIYIDNSLKHRSYNVTHSLGLMYQYAIRFLGMKEFQDEYKLLGYEQNVNKSFKKSVSTLINQTVDETYIALSSEGKPKTDMKAALDVAYYHWSNIFNIVDHTRSREKIAYFVQQVLERVMMRLVEDYDNKNIKVSGGVFYNVKLNNLLLRYSNKFEANPLAGDQGCALGFTDVRYSNLFFGKRHLSGFDKTINQVVEELNDKGYSNIFRGNMEFGPRALGNTTCLVVPTSDNIAMINELNGRDNVMPMAPMITEEVVKTLFKDTEKVRKSKQYMIIAYDYKAIDDSFIGAAHIDSERGVYTGRFQVTQDQYLVAILDSFDGILVNTSLNAHGQPILYDEQDYTKMKELQHA